MYMYLAGVAVTADSEWFAAVSLIATVRSADENDGWWSVCAVCNHN